MKKLLMLMLCMFAIYNIFAECRSEEDFNEKGITTCESCEKYLKNYYFSLDDLIIENGQLYLNFNGEEIISIAAMYKDNNGYFIKIWIDNDNDYCPNCGYRTWNETYGCCSNPPSVCKWSCQNKYKAI